jgi:predicted CopG family antitoxin
MATKTISIELDVYDRLKSLRSKPKESFSEVLRRTLPAPRHWTAGDLAAALLSGEWTGMGISEEGLQLIEDVGKNDSAPTDPWLEEEL